MSANELKGQVKQVKGAVKEAVGNITGNRTLAAKGKIQNLVGKAQEKIGQVERHADDRAAARRVNDLDRSIDGEL